MSLSEAVIIVIISSIASLLGGGLVFLVSWRKAGAEMHKSEGEANSANAEAAKTWAESNQLAAQQNVEIQKELKEERRCRMELESEFAAMKVEFDRIKNRVKRLEAQVISLGAEPVN